MSISAQGASKELAKYCQIAPVIPILVVEDVNIAIPLAQALVAGGLPVLEVTLRTPVALEVIRAMRSVEGAIVGAGTLVTPAQVEQAKEAGAVFGVSPGTTDALITACEEQSLPLMGGISTASEAMKLLEKGYTVGKFFPAEAAGGIAFLKSIYGPLPQMQFCPTGGLTIENVGDYLTLPNVLCAGGSWVAPKSLTQKMAWDKIERIAKEASTLSISR